MGRLSVLLLGLLIISTSQAQENSVTVTEGSNQPSAAMTSESAAYTLTQLARESDLVAVVRVHKTEYRYTREFPSGGSAFLQVLLPYKASQRHDLVEVTEEGLKDNECYFPTTPEWEPGGARFLVFLKQGEGERFTGHPGICALPVLVTQDNRYAVRWPADKLDINEADREKIRALEFSDPDAYIPTQPLSDIAIEALQAEKHMRLLDNSLVYTQGIYISDVRMLMGPDALIPDA